MGEVKEVMVEVKEVLREVLEVIIRRTLFYSKHSFQKMFYYQLFLDYAEIPQ